MALYNRFAEDERIKSSLAYEKLRDEINYTSENIYLCKYLDEMESTIKKQNKELEEYRKFFSLLQKLSPKPFNENTILI